MKDIYSYIKFLKKALHLDLNSYLLKKELLKDHYKAILDSCGEGAFSSSHLSRGRDHHVGKDDMALVQILCQPFFRNIVGHKIDLQESSKWGYVHLKSKK